MCFTKFWRFSVISSSTIFCTIFFSFQDLYDINIGLKNWVHVSLKLFFFFSTFCLFFRLGNFYWSDFKSTNSYPSHLHSTIEPIQLIFISYSIFSILSSPFGSLFLIVSTFFLLRTHIFSIHFKSVHLYLMFNDYWVL